MGSEKMEEEIRTYMERKNQMAQDIVDFFREKEPGITFEKAEKFLLDTIDVLRNVSKSREI